MICEGCGCVFCWDKADEGTLCGTRKLYCSETCRQKSRPGYRPGKNKYAIRRHLGLGQRTRCYFPGKRRFKDREAAELIAVLSADRTLYSYECSCGSWHLTSEPPRLESDVDPEFDAFLAEFAEVNLEASGVPEAERELWRGLR